MSFNYKGDPSTSNIDAVRFLLGDVDEDSYEFEDEEISWGLTQETDIWFAAALLADTRVAKYSGQPTSKTIGETSVTYGDRTMKFTSLASQLRSSRRQMAVTPWAGGWKKSQKDAMDADDDRRAFVAKVTEVPEPTIGA